MSERMIPPDADQSDPMMPADGMAETTQAFVVPQVNLLPASFARAVKVRRARLTALITVITAVLLVALAWLIGLQQRSAAQEKLDIATAETMLLHAKAQEYADVPKVFAEVADAQVQLRRAMGNEVRWSFFLNDLALTMPSGVSLDSLDATAAEPGAAPTGSDSQSGAATIGALNVSAQALTFNHVANWLDSLAKLPTLVNPEALTMNAVDAEGRDLVGFSSAASVTTEALSGRYTKEGGQVP